MRREGSKKIRAGGEAFDKSCVHVVNVSREEVGEDGQGTLYVFGEEETVVVGRAGLSVDLASAGDGVVLEEDEVTGGDVERPGGLVVEVLVRLFEA